MLDLSPISDAPISNEILAQPPMTIDLLSQAGDFRISQAADNRVAQASSSTSSFSGSPSTIPNNHAGHITLTLTGTGTAWDITTVFALSGVSGAALVSYNVASATAATLVLTTGAGTGTLTITESVTGTNTATVTVRDGSGVSVARMQKLLRP